MARILFLWFVKVALVFAAAKSHKRMVQSWLPVITLIKMIKEVSLLRRQQGPRYFSRGKNLVCGETGYDIESFSFPGALTSRRRSQGAWEQEWILNKKSSSNNEPTDNFADCSWFLK